MVLLPGRILIRNILRSGGEEFFKKSRSIIITDAASIPNWERTVSSTKSFIGFVSSLKENITVSVQTGILGDIDDLDEIIQRNKITDIIFASENVLYRNALSKIMKLSRTGLNLYSVLHNRNYVLSAKSIKVYSGIELVPIDLNINRINHKFLKRFIDIFFSFSGIIFWLITFIIYFPFSGLKIKKREISGFYTKNIIIRSLYKGSSLYTGIFKNFLSFFYILKGKLSIVGEEIVDIEKNSKQLVFKPGLLNDPFKHNENNDIITENTLFYLKNYSFLLDLKVISKKIFR